MLLAHWLQQLFPRFQLPNFERRRRFIRRRKGLLGLQGSVGIVQQCERLEDRTLLSTFYVDDSFANQSAGTDPDGTGPATSLGSDAFASIQAAINAASNGDTILIAPGTYTESITIGKSLTLQGVGGQASDVLINPVSGPGIAVVGTAGIVSLAGLKIDTGTGTGVFLNSSTGTATTLNLNNVDASDAGADGLFVNVAYGSQAFVNLTGGISFNNAGANAINVVARSGAAVTLNGNGVTGTNARADGIHIASTSSTVAFNLTGGSFANAGDDGLDVAMTGGSDPGLALALSGGNFSGAGHNGVVMTFNNYVGYSAAHPTFTFDRLDLSGAKGNAFSLTSSGSAARPSTFNGVVTNSNLDNAGGYAFMGVLSGNTPQSRIHFEDTMMRNAGADAVYLGATDSSHVALDIIDGDLTGSARKNVNIQQDKNSTVDFFIDPTKLDHGFTFSGSNGTVLNSTVLDTPLSTAGNPSNYGIYGTLTSGATMNLQVINSASDKAIFDGMYVTANQGSTFNVTFNNSSLTNSGRRGMFLDLDNSKATLNFNNGSVITGSTVSNVQLQARNGSQATVKFDATSGNISGAAVDGLNLLSDGAGSNVQVTFAGLANLNNNGRDGLVMTSNNGGILNVYAQNGLSITGAGDNAIQIFGNGANATLVADNVSLSSTNNTLAIVTGSSSRVITTLTNVGTVRSNQGDAVNFNNSSQGFFALTMTGTAASPMLLQGVGGSGIDGTSTNNCTSVLVIDQFRIIGAKEDGVKLSLNSSFMSTSRITNGIIRDSGQGGGLSAGISISEVSSSSIGTRGAGDFGFVLQNLTLDNTTKGGTQDYGLKVTADSNSYSKMRLTSSIVQNNASHGVLVSVNPDNSASDNALVDLNLGSVNILNNSGDGVNLTARRGNNTIASMTSGIIFTLGGDGVTTGLVQGNANSLVGDGLGDGIDANAFGDASGPASNTTIALNLTNVSVTNNEELQLRLTAQNGGAITTNQTGGSYSGNNGTVEVIADGSKSANSLTLNNVKLTAPANPNNAGAAIVMAAINGGFATGSFNNMTGANQVTGFGAQAFVFLADTGGTLNASFNNVTFANNLRSTTSNAVVAPTLPAETQVNALGVNANVQGMVRGAGSTANVSFTNTTISGNTTGRLRNGVEVDVQSGGAFTSTVRNLTVTGTTAAAGEGDFQVRADGASTQSTLDIDGLTVVNSKGRGVDLQATNQATVRFPQLNHITADAAQQQGLLVLVNSGASLGTSFNLLNSSFNASKTANGVGLTFNTAAAPQAVNVSITNSSADSSRFVGFAVSIIGPTGSVAAHHSITVNNSHANGVGTRGLDIGVNGMAAGQTVDIAVVNNSAFNNSGITGVNLQFQPNSGATAALATVNLSDLSANGAKTATGINLFFAKGVYAQTVSLTNVTATGAAASGLSISTDTGMGTRLLNVALSGTDFSGAGANGVYIGAGPQTAPAVVSLESVTADNAGGRGVWINLNTVQGGASSIKLASVNARNSTGGNGLEIDAVGLSATDSVGITLTTCDFSGGAGDGTNINLSGASGSTAKLDITGLTVNGSTGGDGFDFAATGGLTATVSTFTGVSANSNSQDGLKFAISGGSKLTNFVSSGLTLDNNATGGNTFDGINVSVTGANSQATFNFSGLNITNSVDINNENIKGRGINLNVGGASTASLTFNINGSGNNITNAGLQGINIGVTGGSTFTGSFTNLNIQNSGRFATNTADGLAMAVTGANSRGNLTLSGVSSIGSDEDGFDISYAAGTRGSLTLTNGTTGANNAGRGLAFSANAAGSVGSPIVFNSNVAGTVNSFNNNGSHGVDVLLTNAAVVNLTNLAATATNNTGDGIRVIANDGTSVNLPSGLGITATNININGNTGNGLTVDLNAVVGITSFNLSGMTVTNNFGDQISAHFTSMTLSGGINLSNVTATGRGAGSFTATGTGDGVELVLDKTTVTGSLSLSRITATGNDEDGLNLQLLNGSSIPAGSVIDVGTFNNNGRYGINIGLDSPDASAYVQTTATLNITNSTYANQNTTASESNNGIAGINISLQHGAMLTTTIDQQTSVNSNGGSAIRTDTNRGGILVSASPDTNTLTDASFTGVVTRNTVNSNLGYGFHGQFLSNYATVGAPNLDLSIGSRTVVGNGNTFSGNRGSGILIDLIQSTVGQVAILDNVITGTTDLGAGLNGQGINIRMLGTNSINQATNTLNATGTGIGDPANNVTPGLLISRNKIGVTALGAAANNNGAGIFFDLHERSIIDGTHILNNTVSNSTNGNGIDFTRLDEVVINDFFIDENVIRNNVNGISLIGQNLGSAATLFVQIGKDGQRDGAGGYTNTDNVNRSSIASWLNTLDGNVISNNRGDGVFLQVRADAVINVGMEENRIEANTRDGIEMNVIVQSSGDAANISGLWNQNVLANNANYGIYSIAPTPNGITFQDGFIGAVLDAFGNVSINGNGLSGVMLTGSGFWTFNNLDVLMNGQAVPRATTSLNAEGHGFDIEALVTGVSISNATIRQNNQDGIQVMSGGTNSHHGLALGSNGFTIGVAITDSRIIQNYGRGVNLLTVGDSRMNVTISGSQDPRAGGAGNANPPMQISSNGEEGVYLVNSSDSTQDQNVYSNVALLATGSVTRVPRTTLSIVQADISNNGNTVIATQGGALPSAGVVVRVGTSDGNYGLLSSQAVNTTNGGNPETGGFFTASSNSNNRGYGGVGMTFTTNRLHGNFGDDVFFHSFVSTTTPTTQAGTWDNTNFNTTNSAGDPLARFDLNWGTTVADQNEYDTLRLVNNTLSGASGQAGAFYNDGDGTFKSRTTQAAPNQAFGGPFTSASRRRNAQRLAERVYDDGTQLLPSAGPNPGNGANPYLYPGIGDSTFRVHATSGNALDLPTFGFVGQGGFQILDGTAANGYHPQNMGQFRAVGFTGANIFGESPFGWGVF